MIQRKPLPYYLFFIAFLIAGITAIPTFIKLITTASHSLTLILAALRIIGCFTFAILMVNFKSQQWVYRLTALLLIFSSELILTLLNISDFFQINLFYAICDKWLYFKTAFITGIVLVYMYYNDFTHHIYGVCLPDEPMKNPLLEKAYNLANEKKYVESLKLCKELLKKEPNNIDVQYLKGTIFEQQDKNEEAIKIFTNILKTNSKYYMALLHRGYCYAELSDKEKAISDLTRCIKLEKRFPFAYFNRGNIYLNSEEPDKTIPDFKKFLELSDDSDPNYSFAKEELEKLLNERSSKD